MGIDIDVANTKNASIQKLISKLKLMGSPSIKGANEFGVVENKNDGEVLWIEGKDGIFRSVHEEYHEFVVLKQFILSVNTYKNMLVDRVYTIGGHCVALGEDKEHFGSYRITAGSLQSMLYRDNLDFDRIYDAEILGINIVNGDFYLIDNKGNTFISKKDDLSVFIYIEIGDWLPLNLVIDKSGDGGYTLSYCAATNTVVTHTNDYDYKVEYAEDIPASAKRYTYLEIGPDFKTVHICKTLKEILDEIYYSKDYNDYVEARNIEAIVSIRDRFVKCGDWGKAGMLNKRGEITFGTCIKHDINGEDKPSINDELDGILLYKVQAETVITYAKPHELNNITSLLAKINQKRAFD